jgi:DNA-binding SARP family transcriptional activator
MDAHLEIQLLGDFRLVYRGKVLTGVDTPRLQSLLAYLLLHRDSPIPRKLIAFNYWPDSTEAKAHNNLRSLLHRLRNSLPDADEYIEHTNSWIRWRCESSYRLDVEQFQIAIKDANLISSPDKLIKSLIGLIDLYSGDLLPGCYEDWIIPLRDHLQSDFLSQLDKLIEILESQRKFQEAIRYAQKYLRYQPYQESAHQRMMRLHALNNDRASGLHAYHTCVRVLQNELGIDPSNETRLLYDQILNSNTSLTKELPENRAPFVGRTKSWQQLVSTWRKQASGNYHPGLVLISGEAGIGKTRLAEEFIEWARRQGITTASANAYPSERQLAYAPVISWLRTLPIKGLPSMWLAEIARLAPDIVGDNVLRTGYQFLDEYLQRRQMFDALKQAVIFQHKSILLFLDDAHWADDETIDWLHYLLRSDIKERLLVILTIRKESLHPKHALQTCLSDLHHHNRLLEINLEPLSKHECYDLAISIARRELPVETIDRLYQHSEGNPFFLEETIRAADLEKLSTQSITDTPGSFNFDLSPKIHNLLAVRLEQLTPKTRAIVNIAAILGRSFTGSVLAEAAEIDEDTLLQALDELWLRRIVRERGNDTYDFSHDLLRQAAFSALSPARRQLLHRQAAKALKIVYSTRQEEYSSQIAIQYDAGGVLSDAIRWYQRAARQSRKIFALQEAITHLQRAVDLLSKVDVSVDQRIQLFEELGDLLSQVGKHVESREAYEKALKGVVAAEDYVVAANLWRKIASVYKSTLKYEDASKAYQTAMSLINSDSNLPKGLALSTWLDIQLDHLDLLYMQDDMESMITLIDHLNPILSSTGSPLQKSNFATNQVMLLSRQERFVLSEMAVRLSQQAFDTAVNSGDIYQIAYKRFSLGFVMLWHGDLEKAEVNLRQSLDEARLIGHIPLQDRCLAYLCIVKRLRGHSEPLRDLITEHQKIAAMEVNSLYLGVANANLAWLAWKDGDHLKVEQLATQALDLWQTSEYPFCWLALFPLLGIMVSNGDLYRAYPLAAHALGPNQQALPPSLKEAFQAAMDAWDQGDESTSQRNYQLALEIANTFGYI